MEEAKKNDLSFLCMIISHLSRHRIEGVPTAQYEILDILSTQGSQTAGALAQQRGVSKSNISKLTRVLLEKGYVTQERDQADRRYYHIAITQEGIAFLERSKEFREELLTRIRQALTEEEFLQWSSLCKKIVAWQE